MKIQIDITGTMKISGETKEENFALRCWTERATKIDKDNYVLQAGFLAICTNSGGDILDLVHNVEYL